jgi:quinol-cytochrome oxidoreductase complex cytochrome b subunit
MLHSTMIAFYNISLSVTNQQSPEFWRIVVGAFIGAIVFHFVLRFFDRHSKKKN